MTRQFHFTSGQATVVQDIRLVRDGGEYYCEPWVRSWIQELARQGFTFVYAVFTGDGK